MSNALAILMATYNGEKYLREQIDSILNQTYQNFILYIRDDNSNDSTINIIKEYTRKYPQKVVMVEDENTAHGAIKNFMFLLQYVNSLNKYDLFMFADQDDIWINDKVETTINKYIQLNVNEEPILIHTDLYVVNEKLNTISNSFVEYSNLKSNYNEFNKYLVQNNVTGCTMLINKKLVELVDFNIKNIKMHDWYFALLASAFGKVIYINKQTIKYRQHGGNVVGAKKAKGIKYYYNKLFNDKEIKKNIEELYNQAKTFDILYGTRLKENDKKIIKDFIEMEHKSRIRKIYTIIKDKMYKQGFSRVIGEFILF